MKSMNKILATTALVMMPFLANAQTSESGYYVGAGVGASGYPNQKINNNFGVNGKVDDSLGGVGSLSLGYQYGNGFRSEVQADFRSNEVESFASVGTKGQRHQYGAFLNGFYDIPVALGGIVPYVGAGVGYEQVDYNAVHVPGYGVNLYGNRGSVAIQGIVGASYPIEAVPGLSMTAEYRLVDLPQHSDYHYSQYASFRPEGGFNSSGLVGLRYSFGGVERVASVVPAPAPVAVTPAPAPARTYLVFFDWDKADLNDRARAIVADAAKNVGRVHVTRIDVNGHADKSGSSVYNKGLSERRAEVVANELVRDGVSRNSISIHAYGDTMPLVTTADGVREPQNRRVEIVFH